MAEVRKMPQMKRNNVIAGVLAFAMVGSVLAAVANTEGFRETKVNLNEGGVWVTTPGRVGRINTQIKSIEVAIAGGKDTDVAQSGDVVVLFDRVKGELRSIDVAREKSNETVKIPGSSMVALGGPVGTVVDPGKGRVWMLPSSEIGSLDVGTTKPVWQAKGDQKELHATIGVDGTVHVYQPGSKELRSFVLDGAGRVHKLDDAVAQASVTAVGSSVVILDGDTQELIIPGAKPVDLSGFGDDLVLQQPGPAADRVLVGAADELVAVPLTGGVPVVLAEAGAGGPAAPVWVIDSDGAGCAFGAWKTGARWARWCQGEPEGVTSERFADDAGKVKRGNDLRFRVNRDRVVLNDATSGVNLLVDEEEPTIIDDWDQARDQDKDDDQDQQESTQKDQAQCSDSPPKPRPKDDGAGTRPGRPIIVDVLTNDDADPCDVLSVKPFTDAQRPDAEVASVAVVKSGAAIQVTPAAGQTAPISIPYTALGKGGEASATLTVSITPDGVNQTPETINDETVVDTGRTVRHNVLTNDIDPDGDALTLTSVGPDPTGGSFQFQSNGIVTYTPAGGFVGLVTLPYTVTDGMGDDGEATGKLDVRVQAGGSNLAPKARNDRLIAFVGKPAQIDVLINDTDPNGDKLTLNALEEDKLEDLGGTFDPDGTVSIEPTAAGEVFITYTIDDGQDTATGQLFVDVRETTSNLPPIAVRDDVVVRPGTPALVDLIANDVDPDGDLLAVTSIEADPSLGLSVELLDMRVARVTASTSFTVPGVVSYTVSDGSSTAVGKLVVRPLYLSEENQTPVATDDTGSVRAGNTTAVAVLRNDIDPEGEQLRITKVVAVDEAQGRPFVQGDEIRFQAAPDNRRPVTLIYDIADPDGNPAAAEVRIDIIPPEQKNRAPKKPTVASRVFEGGTVSVRVPLVGLDPDGDTVAIVGVDPSGPPTLGTVEIVGDGFIYTADKGASGTDRFQFIVSDPAGARTVGTARVLVAPRADKNTPPTAVPDRLTMAPGESRSVPVLDNDTDLDGQALSLLTGEAEGPTTPSIGEVAVSDDGTEVVFQAPSSVGDKPVEVSFTYGVTDGPSASRGVVTVVIDPGEIPNEPPIAVDDFHTAQLKGRTVTVDVLANDRDPDGEVEDLDIEVLDFPGAKDVGGGQLEVELGETSVAFVYRVTDPDGDMAMALVSIPVVDSLPPATTTPIIEMEAGGTETIDLLKYVSDPGGNDSSLKILKVIESTVRGGASSLDGTTVTFEAETDWPGDAGFSYIVSNGADQSLGSVRIVLTGQNQKPTFRPPDVVVPEGGVREFDLQEYVVDPDTTVHQFSGPSGAVPGKIDAPPLRGSVLKVSGGLTAKGAATTLVIEVDDGLNTETMSVPVQVVPNDKDNPTAVADTAETEEDVDVTVPATRNDVDPIGGGLKVIDAKVQGGPRVGSATANDGNVVFTPTRGWFGTALVTYVIEDASERQTSGTIQIDVYGRPGRPPAPTGTAESKLVRLQWGTPTRNGAPITGYVVRESGGGKQVDAGSNAAVIDGLTNNKAYRFQVAALNRVVTNAGEVRADEWSDPSPALTPDAVPDQPAQPTVTFDKDRNNGGSGGVLHVAWTPPNVDGSPVKEYTVRVSPVPGGSAPTKTVPASTTRLEWAGLTNGTAYSFAVTAINSAGANANNSTGKSLESLPSTSETPAGIPSAVTGVQAQRVTEGRNNNGGLATVRWNDSSANGDPDGLRYVVSTDPSTSSKEVAGSPTELSGLSTNQGYTFSVVAHNKAGKTEPAASPGGVFADGIPQAPASPSFRPGDGKIIMAGHLTSAQPNGRPDIVSYQYSFTNSSSPSSWSPISGDEIRSGNGTRSSVWVRACKNVPDGSGKTVGCGESSQASNTSTGDNWVTPFGAPSVNASVLDRTITWRWVGQAGVDRYDTNGQSGLQSCGENCVRKTFGYSERRCLQVTAIGQGDIRQASGEVCATTVIQPPPYTGVVTEDEVPITDAPRATHDTSAPSSVVEWKGRNSTVRYMCQLKGGKYYTNGSNSSGGLSDTWLRLEGVNRYIPEIWVNGTPKPNC